MVLLLVIQLLALKATLKYMMVVTMKLTRQKWHYQDCCFNGFKRNKNKSVLQYLLEPIMDVDSYHTQSEYVGNVIGDINITSWTS